MKIRFSASIFHILLGCFTAIWAAAPNAYYSSCEGKSGAALLAKLCDVVGPHTVVSYNGLWDIYPETDSDDDGKLWDMYSTKRWTWGNKPCGNYSNVGDCYNREHSMPKSWFNDHAPMVSDAFHVYPTDGKVNGQRSNNPYGECANGASVGSNGSVKPLGKLGSSTFPGYTGTVFEPDDEYKGDFARTYFYMAAAYNDQIAGWSSPQLAGNAYPAFSDWSVELLLKWHRQDPVSKKETDRNEAVYAYQHNRNPFIDHPEMAEHIWGNKKGEGWSNDAPQLPEFALPVDGSEIDFGTMAAGISRNYTVSVRGSYFSQPVSVSVSGTGFSLASGSSTLSADAVNHGTSVSITALCSYAANLSGVLTLSCGSIKREVMLKAEVVNGLPALPATDITETSFVARWVDVDENPGVMYRLHVNRDGHAVSGYPKEVVCTAEQYEVENLDPSTTYTYYLESATLVSNSVTVTTGAPSPSIQAVYEGDLSFIAVNGEPSEPKEITLIVENIPGDITVDIAQPFELSMNKIAWSNSLTLEPGDESFYLRLGNGDNGTHTASLRFSAAGYEDDEETVIGIVRSNGGLNETFETGRFKDSYTDGTWDGIECTWMCKNVGIYQSDKSLAFEGEQCARFGKNATSTLQMDEDTHSGIGTVSFMGKPWGDDASVSLALEYSTDGGTTWEPAASFTMPSKSEYSEYSAVVNQENDVRMRLRQTAGSRALIDNITATPYSSTSIAASSCDIRAWDAFCVNGKLMLESPAEALFTVYSYDGATVLAQKICGSRGVSLPAGVYIVVSGDFSKKVVIK